LLILLSAGLVLYVFQDRSSPWRIAEAPPTLVVTAPVLVIPSPTSGLVPTPPERLLTPTLEPVALDESGAIPIYSRAGFCVTMPVSTTVWAERLGAGWYVDWQATETFGEPPEHWRMVRTTPKGIHPGLDRIRELAEDGRGRAWIIGNEPDVIWQDNLPPEDYAHAYGELYDTIKGVDPTAVIAVGGISQATPLRLQYLDRVLEAYQKIYGASMPVDWWTVHGYVLREEHKSWGVEIPPGIQAEQGILFEISDHGRIDYFEKHLRDFRAWMARNGYQNTPLALTEFGILMPAEYGFPPEFVVGYLRDTFYLLETLRDETTGYPYDDYRLVQRWAWYSLAEQTYATADLADLENDRLTPVGVAFREFTLSKMTP
jgi:hypothetical protein